MALVYEEKLMPFQLLKLFGDLLSQFDCLRPSRQLYRHIVLVDEVEFYIDYHMRLWNTSRLIKSNT